MTSSCRVPWKVGLGIAVLLALPGCEDVSVTAVDVASVGITPAQGELFPGDTLRLAVTLKDASGTPLPGRTVSWSSDDPSVASVDSSGRVQAAAVGETRIRAGAGSVEGSSVVTVRQFPDIMLSESQVLFQAVAGQGVVAPRSIQVTSGGAAPLSGLSVQVDPEVGGGATWLEATLSGPQAPATLTLRASAASLSAGTYHAAVLVQSAIAGNSPRTLPVEFSVGAQPASIRLSSMALGFAWEAGQDVPPPQSVSITNGGEGQITQLGTAIRYGSGEPSGWLSAQLSATTAPATLTLSVTPGDLSTGVYSAYVDVSSPGVANSPQELRVRLTAGSPPPEIELSPVGVSWVVTEDEEIPAQRQIDVTNRGSGALTGLGASVSYAAGDPTGWLNAELVGSAAPAALVLTVTTTALPPGNHTATVAITSGDASNSPQTATAGLSVLPRVAPELSGITADPDTLVANGASSALITVRLRDPRGDPYTLAGANVALATTAGTLGAVTGGQGGTYSAVLTAPSEAGEAVISGTVNGAALGDSARVTFVETSGSVSASLSTAVAIPENGIVADGTAVSTVNLRIRDTEGNDVAGLANEDFAIALTGTAQAGPVTPGAIPGAYIFLVTNTVAESVTVTITAVGVTLDDQPTIQFTSASVLVSAALSTVTVSPDTAVIANGTSAFTVGVRIRDPDGNFVRELKDEDFRIALTGSAQAGPVTSRPPPGAHEFKVTNTVAEAVTVTVTVLGVTLDDQPALRFRSGPISAEASSVTASPSTEIIADESDASIVTIELRDAHGNPIGGIDDDDFSVDISGDGDDGSLSETNSSGTYAFKVTNATAETVTVRVRVHDITLDDQPTITFVPGSVSGDESSAWADPSSGIVPDGTDASIVTVELRDENDNPIGGVDDDRFTVQLTGSAIRTAVSQSDTLGTYTFAVTNTTAQKVEVTISVDGVTIDDRPEIEFDGEPDSAGSPRLPLASLRLPRQVVGP